MIPRDVGTLTSAVVMTVIYGELLDIRFCAIVHALPQTQAKAMGVPLSYKHIYYHPDRSSPSIRTYTTQKS